MIKARLAVHRQRTGQGASSLFVRFSEEPVFRFFHPSLSFPDDRGALAQARQTNLVVAEKLISVGDSSVGYIPSLLQATHPPGHPTMNTCRHIKRLTLLLHQLEVDGVATAGASGSSWNNVAIVEIGGGNGNMARLVARAVGFQSWTIFDMPVMTQLQEWYLKKTLKPDFLVTRNPKGVAPGAGGIQLVDTGHIWQHLHRAPAGGFTWDALVASHSWSELPMETFHMYFAALGDRVRYILYVLHTIRRCF